jgi:hypothetical protein
MTDVGERIRDRWFAAGSEAERGRLIAEADRLDARPITTLQGLSLSYFPTARFTRLRFIEATELDESIRSKFARPCAELPELAAAFVDPEEFSYRTFENVIGLDRLFAGLGDAPIHFSKPRRTRGVSRLTARVSDPLRARLEQLDRLDLHVRPPNAGSRGGTRFIFHCTELAAALSEALRGALPESILRGFIHVNPVFRCNRFEPGDSRFLAHVDSPYHDRSRHHVSKYTLLLYLTGGRGEGALCFGEKLVIDEIPAMTAFVFPQGLVHEGGPFADGPKVFLRTELIFEDPKIEHSPGIAEIFAKACYLGTQSPSIPELERFAHEAYDRAAAAHFRGPPDSVITEPFLHKQFRGAHFVSNGYDYWFRKSDLSLIESAALALLDLLNAKIGESLFRRLCTTQVLVGSSDHRSWITDFLRGVEPPPESPFARLSKATLFPEPPEPIEEMDFPTSPDFSPDPYPADWDSTRNPEVLEAFARARRWAMKRVLSAPITMLGKEVFLAPERFVIESGMIHVLSNEALGPVHFAGAVFFGPYDFIDAEVLIDTLQPLVPPIAYRETDDLIHLTCDLFRNSWMVGHRTQSVPVPRVIDGRVRPDTAPWYWLVAGDDYNPRLAELESDN